MLLEVVLNSIFYGQNCVNRFNYIGSGTPAASSMSNALAAAMGFLAEGAPGLETYPDGTLFHKLRLTQSAAVVYQQFTTKDVYSDTDFYQSPFVPVAAGLIAAGGAATVLAMGYRTNVVNLSIRRGMKRFAGLPDNVEADGGVITTEQKALMSTLAAAMSSTLTYDDEGNTLTFTPCVVSKEKYTPDPAKPTKVAYRYYDTLSEQMTHVAQGVNWEIYTNARSQVSRQVGRGS